MTKNLRSMSNIWLVISYNDLGYSIHGVYTTEDLAIAARDRINKRARESAQQYNLNCSYPCPYSGDRHFILSGNVNKDPEENWGDEDRTGYGDNADKPTGNRL